MQQQTSQPVAVVTGASSGFGRLTAEALAKAGYRTYAGIRDGGARNAAIAAELRAQGIEPIELDVTSDVSVEAAAQHVLASADRVDVLVNNAGAAYFGLVEAFTPQAVHTQFDVNVYGPLRVNRAFLPQMRKQKSGLVVYVSSVVGRFTTPFIGVYAASKFALEALAETTAYELRPFNIDVSIVQPGAYVTNIGSRGTVADDQARIASYGEVASGVEKVLTSLAQSASDRPGEVADAIVEIAQLSPGTRPLRRVVGGDRSPAPAINEMLAPIGRSVLEAWGLESYLPPKEPAISR